MMSFFKNYYLLIATWCFVLAIVCAHIVATNHYDWTKNTISDLGAQGYEKQYIMQVGFIAFGVVLAFGIMLHGITWKVAPILVYGVCVGLTGIFCTQPFFDVANYSVLEAMIHSRLAQTAGVAFTLGILVQLYFASGTKEKLIHAIFFVLVIGLSASFGLVQHYQGIVQRLLYATSFLWLVKFYKHN
jgi:hypothetical membrane protein